MFETPKQKACCGFADPDPNYFGKLDPDPDAQKIGSVSESRLKRNLRSLKRLKKQPWRVVDSHKEDVKGLQTSGVCIIF